MSTRRCRAEWVEVVDAYRLSGESLERFARRRGIKPTTLQWWTWRLSREDVRLVPVEVRQATVEVDRGRPEAEDDTHRGIIEIIVAGVHVRFVVGADAKYVSTLVAELRRC